MFNQPPPINLAEAVSPKLETLTDKFSTALYIAGLGQFDFQPDCPCPVCQLESRISSIYGILELEQSTTTSANQAEQAVA